MADVSIAYKGSVIAEMDEAGSKTLGTGGCYCEGDVTVSYTPRTDDTYRHWDVTVSGTVSSNQVTILKDDWLKQHRSDTNLAVAVIPKFVLPYTSGNGNQGIYLCTNSNIVTDSNSVLYKSISAYVHSGGTIAARARKYGLTNANDMGDLYIATDGTLKAVAYGNFPFIAGEYCVFAFLM